MLRLLSTQSMRSFHSTDFPYERGHEQLVQNFESGVDFPYERGRRNQRKIADKSESFHSTDFPYERGRMIGWMLWIHRLSFHSTDFPYERGPGRVRGTSCCTRIMVSIQLISPTRGDIKRFALPGYFKYQVSIQLISPTRGDQRGDRLG